MLKKDATTDYPVHELIRRRWSPRAFASSPVAAETLGSLLEAARWAPSAMNEQPWSFIVARQDQPQEFARLLACLVPGNQSWARQAPVLMIALARRRFDRNDKPNRHAWHDVGLAVGQLTLQATALGLVVHQMGGIDGDKIRESYAVPDSHEPVTGIAIGYPGDPDALPDNLRERELAPRQRKPLAEIVLAGTWGA